MRRLRFLRVAIPTVLVVFAVLVVLALRERPRPRKDSLDTTTSGPRIEGFTFTDFVGDRVRLSVSARLGRLDPDGTFHLEDVESLELGREDAPPLIVTAQRGVGSGRQGQRLVRLEGGVEVRDDSTGLVVKLPSLEIDQANGEARSLGAVAIESPSRQGRAESVVYGLEGHPTEIGGLDMAGKDGSVLRARRAVVRSDRAEIDLIGEVHYESVLDGLDAEHVRVVRDEQGRWRSLRAEGSVNGVSRRQAGTELLFRASRASAFRAETGEVESIDLDGDVRIQRGTDTLAARTVNVTRSRPSDTLGWTLVASDDVLFVGGARDAESRLQAARIQVDTDAVGQPVRGEAVGDVRFEGRDGAGRAEAAAWDAEGAAQVVTLRAGPGRRARLASGRTRVAADTIRTDPSGGEIVAEGRVDATLLPEPRSGDRRRSGLFDASQAVHFVSGRLESRSGGKEIRFLRDVRGWQGDRHLAADEVAVDQRVERLSAEGRVSTRLPRESGIATSEADFIQVTADTLDYRGIDRVATYGGDVRIRQSEGWIECDRLEILLSEEGSGARLVRGFESVRFEFKAQGRGGLPEPVTGIADRVVYDPGGRTVRLFGDRRPAEIRRGGADGGMTAGRVLRYALDSGSIQVESNADAEVELQR